MFKAPSFIEKSDPRGFCNVVLASMSERDKNDLARIRARVGELTIVRMTAATYMDPYFVNGEVEAIYKEFGASVERAYQEMIGKIAALDEKRKTLVNVLV